MARKLLDIATGQPVKAISNVTRCGLVRVRYLHSKQADTIDARRLKPIRR
ncbi:hypothetical protein [Sciscionella sediminilitoris]|nr:hypothetical protein [Sciscionella sp. SE31]